MKNKNFDKKKYIIRPSKECAYIGIFVALIIALQLALSFVPGVELVTILFICYSFIFGITRGLISATAFSLLRQFVFGFNPTVIILYLIYYNLLCLIFGLLGKTLKIPKHLYIVVIIAVLLTAIFTLLDDLITPLFYSYSQRATKAYFYASLTFMLPQVICNLIASIILFIPLTKTFTLAKKGLIC